MKSLLCGEQIREIIPVQTKFGNCKLYFTNFAMTLESVTKGLILELGHESVISFQPIEKKSLRLIWSENNSVYDVIINYEKPENIVNKFKEIQNNHINSLKTIGIKTKEISRNKLIPFTNQVTQLHNCRRIIKAFEVKKSVHGKGIFYITNFGIYFESQKYGTIIKVDFKWLKSYNAIKKKTFQIVWNTENNNRFSYEVEIKSAEEVMITYREINEEYAKSMTETQALKSKYIIAN